MSNANFQRRHFELIASTIRGLSVDQATRVKVANEFASGIGWTNSNFNRERFIEACGANQPEVAVPKPTKVRIGNKRGIRPAV